MTGEFAAIEARLWAILAPYRDRLEEGSVYGLVMLKRPGATSHQFFAGVRVASRHVAFHLMPVYTDPSLLDGISPGLRAHLKGKTTFDFAIADEALFVELEGLTARCFDAYMAGSVAL
jgi:hypothetical protein